MADVFLIYQNRLFGDVVRAILATHPEIRLLGASDLAQVSACDLAALAPTVILLEETDGAPAIVCADRLLAGLDCFRLITLAADNNGMHVWQGTWQETIEPADLVHAIIDAREGEP